VSSKNSPLQSVETKDVSKCTEMVLESSLSLAILLGQERESFCPVVQTILASFS
jgi:hypothetical protein